MKNAYLHFCVNNKINIGEGFFETETEEDNLEFKWATEKCELYINDVKIKNWLAAQDAYTLHKPVTSKFKRNRVFVKNIDEQWQADLVDMTNISDKNQGVKFMLTCIEIGRAHV